MRAEGRPTRLLTATIAAVTIGMLSISALPVPAGAEESPCLRPAVPQYTYYYDQANNTYYYFDPDRNTYYYYDPADTDTMYTYYDPATGGYYSYDPAPSPRPPCPTEPRTAPTRSDIPGATRTPPVTDATAAPSTAPDGRRSATPAFPLKVSANGRYLVDQQDRPFFYTADTSWTMLSLLSVADAKKLIDIRKAQGFNALQTILTPFSVTSAGRRGTPFAGLDLRSPQTGYWAGVDEIMDYADSQGMLLYTVPLWMANNGGWGCDDGDCNPVPTIEQMESYLTWIGTRYRDQPNLLWVMGGDDEIDRNRAVKLAGAQALDAADTRHLITYHPRWAEYGFSTESWHDINAFQKNDISAPYNYEQVREAYALSPVKPVLDAEPPYEPNTAMQSGDVTTPRINRRFGWWAALSGAMGVTYGGPADSWRIGRDGPPDWTAVEREPARQTAAVRRILEPLPWYRLVPDWDATTVTDGRGTYGGDDYATAGRTDDGSLVVAFAPSARTFTVDLSRLGGPATARWYDPASGTVAGDPLPVDPAAGSGRFATPGANSAGDDDWILVISTAAVDAAADAAAAEATATGTAAGGTATPDGAPASGPANRPADPVGSAVGDANVPSPVPAPPPVTPGTQP